MGIKSYRLILWKSFYFFCLLFVGTGTFSQAFVLTEQALYYFNHISSPENTSNTSTLQLQWLHSLDLTGSHELSLKHPNFDSFFWLSPRHIFWNNDQIPPLIAPSQSTENNSKSVASYAMLFAIWTCSAFTKFYPLPFSYTTSTLCICTCFVLTD
jgi:hypothetical protein